jgi:MFS family permease
MDRWGLRRLVLCALALVCGSVALTTLMRSQWQLILLWGVCVGSGTGVTALVLAAVVANRWFDRNRGTVLGALTAANATGQLLFLPFLARLLERSGWRSVALAVSASAAVVFVLVLLLMRDRPSDLQLEPYGHEAPPDGGTPQAARISMAPMQLCGTRAAPPLSGCWRAVSSFAERVPTD